MRDAAIRDQLTKTSADLPPNLRELLDKMPIGKLTPPEVTKQGVEMVALCSRKPTKADTPARSESMRRGRIRIGAPRWRAGIDATVCPHLTPVVRAGAWPSGRTDCSRLMSDGTMGQFGQVRVAQAVRGRTYGGGGRCGL